MRLFFHENSQNLGSNSEDVYLYQFDFRIFLHMREHLTARNQSKIFRKKPLKTERSRKRDGQKQPTI